MQETLIKKSLAMQDVPTEEEGEKEPSEEGELGEENKNLDEDEDEEGLVKE